MLHWTFNQFILGVKFLGALFLFRNKWVWNQMTPRA